VLTSIAPTFVGLDLHKDSISVALLRPGQESPDEERIPNTPEEVRRLVGRWSDPASMRVCYEAGPCGYELQRQLRSLGVDCVVIAPALTPRKPGDRVKTDRRDARKLCRLFRAGELTTIRIPPPDEEAVRDLLRLREDLGEDILRARHRLSKFLLRHGRVFRDTTSWTKAHWAWIRAQRFDITLLERLRDEHVLAIEMRVAQRDSLDRELHAIARQPQYAAAVQRLSALRGVQTLTALTLLVEVGDFARFGAAAEFMGFTGLVPSEYSSGGSRHQGSITKTGNSHLRRVLVEAAWAYRVRPTHPSERARRRIDQPPAVLALCVAVEQRLHRRYWRMVQRGKLTQVAAVAIARELAGAVWALMREMPVAG
jgi:transposase